MQNNRKVAIASGASRRATLLRQGSHYVKIYNHFLIVQCGIDEDVLKRVRERASDNETIMTVLKTRIKKIKEAT